ncbi:MAG: Uncharacterised protein [Cryomorphaceae bacterium]|nr:MAG: Uncharacterised protein [Cryomorphaceae bacterium]
MIALIKTIFNQDIIFVLLTISFLLIAMLKSFYWNHAKLLFMGIFAQRYANQYLREENAFTERVSFITFLLMSINISLIILKLVPKTSVLETFSLIVGVMLFFIIKIGLILLLGSIFRVKDIAKLGIFFSLLFDRTFGFLLFPLIILVYFFAFNITPFIMLILAIIFIVLLLLKLFWLWKIGTNAFGLSHFYIFLYLCTLEISPLLLLGKGVVY